MYHRDWYRAVAISWLTMASLRQTFKSLSVILVLSCLVVVILLMTTGCQPASLEVPPQPRKTISIQQEQGLTSQSPGGQAPTAASRNHVGAPGNDNDDTDQDLEEKQLSANGDGDNINRAYEILRKGDFFHTIPFYMNVGQSIVIDAGIGDEINQKLLSSLGLYTEDPFTIIPDKQFDPLGMEFTLYGDQNAFLIEPISTGRKVVIQQSPQVWKWIVTPLKSGRSFLTLSASIQIQWSDESSPSQQEEFTLFEEFIPIQGSIVYSLIKMFDDHWLKVITVIFSFSSFRIGWQLGKLRYRNKQPQGKEKMRSQNNDFL